MKPGEYEIIKGKAIGERGVHRLTLKWIDLGGLDHNVSFEGVFAAAVAAMQGAGYKQLNREDGNVTETKIQKNQKSSG